MKHTILLITIILFYSCGNDKVVILPEINHSDISEIKDVSAAYIFYDETKPDSTELNRRNLISTTNWLVNVDKRLTLKQVIPHIKFLQDKKKSSSHKNENAKNYFTCNDTSKKNLGFIEFTHTEYKIIDSKEFEYHILFPVEEEDHKRDAWLHAITTLPIIIKEDGSINYKNDIISLNQLKSKLLFYLKEYNFIGYDLKLLFHKNLTFQEYIKIKSDLTSIQMEKIHFHFEESIYN